MIQAANRVREATGSEEVHVFFFIGRIRRPVRDREAHVRQCASFVPPDNTVNFPRQRRINGNLVIFNTREEAGAALDAAAVPLGATMKWRI